jgi:hypothetical protein
MKNQLDILINTMHSNWIKLMAMLFTFLSPIYGLLILIIFVITLDTVTGIWKAKKNKIPITSGGASAMISKVGLYSITLVMFYAIDALILNSIILQFFSVELLFTKGLALILVSIEVMSINENYKAVKGLDLWQAMKNLFARAKEIKKSVDEIRHNEDITGTPI